MPGLLQLRLPDVAALQAREPIFVDSTVTVDLVINTPQVRSELRGRMQDREVWTSRYSLMELRRTAIHALVTVRDLALAAPEEDSLWPWMLEQIGRRRTAGGQPPKPNECKRGISVIAAVQRQVRGATPARGMVVGLLTSTIALANNRGWLGIQHVIDETDCDLVRDDRPQGQRWSLAQHCKAMDALCRQSDFLTKNRQYLPAVLAACEVAPRFTPRSLEKLREIAAANPINAKGENRCWPLGDLLIALEARGVGRLLSSNTRDYAPICQTLGVDLDTYVP